MTGYPRTHDVEAWERRRFEAARLLKTGLNQAEIGRRLGVTRAAVNQWNRKFEEGGLEALRRRKHQGPKKKLNRRQLRSLPRILLKGALSYGYTTDLWTAERIAEVIRRTYHVTYHPSQVTRILHAMRFSWQKPRRVASQRNEYAVERWRRTTWPYIKKSP
jgi:transposase